MYKKKKKGEALALPLPLYREIDARLPVKHLVKFFIRDPEGDVMGWKWFRFEITR